MGRDSIGIATGDSGRVIYVQITTTTTRIIYVQITTTTTQITHALTPTLGLAGHLVQDPLRVLEVFAVRLLLLGHGVGVGDDAGAGLHVGVPVLDDRRADRDAGVQVPGEVHVADGTRVADATL